MVSRKILISILLVAPIIVYAFYIIKKNNSDQNEQQLLRKTPETIITDRMIGHRLQQEDLNNLYLLLSNPQVAATLGGVHSLKQTEENLQQWLDHWASHGFGAWAFHDKNTNKFIGRAGLRKEFIDGTNEIVLNYALMPEYWNKGFATEMATALIKIGFEQLNIESIVSFTDSTNKASQRVMEKNGFQFEKTFNYAHLKPVLYRLTKEKYDEIKTNNDFCK